MIDLVKLVGGLLGITKSDALDLAKKDDAPVEFDELRPKTAVNFPAAETAAGNDELPIAFEAQVPAEDFFLANRGNSVAVDLHQVYEMTLAGGEADWNFAAPEEQTPESLAAPSQRAVNRDSTIIRSALSRASSIEDERRRLLTAAALRNFMNLSKPEATDRELAKESVKAAIKAALFQANGDPKTLTIETVTDILPLTFSEQERRLSGGPERECSD